MTKEKTWTLGRWQVTASSGMDVRISTPALKGCWTLEDDVVERFIRMLEERRESSYYAAPEFEFAVKIGVGKLSFPLRDIPNWIAVLQLARVHTAALPTDEVDQTDSTSTEGEC